MTLRLLLPCALLGVVCRSAEPSALRAQGGTWGQAGTPAVISQTDPASADATAWLEPTGSGPCWRAIVELGPYTGTAGLRWGADAQGKGGFSVLLAGSEGGDLLLLGADGKALWQDQGIGWLAYSPLWIEAVQESRGLRVQALAADGLTLLAQSPWLPAAAPDPASASGSLGLCCAGNTARFCLPQRSPTPLAEYSEDNPSALRVPQAGDGSWLVSGGGAWRWRDRERKILLQTRPVERTTAFMTAPNPAAGVWRCRLRLDHGSCGGGMLIQADKDLQNGFLAWLGGNFGDGGLMVYRYPVSALWSSPQGIWKWDTEYVLEAALQDRTVRARLLAADGTTVLAESPALPITAEEAQRTGMTGFQTWHGTGQFSAFTGSAAVAAAPAAPTGTDLGDGWLAMQGLWEWQDATHQCLQRRDGAGIGSAVGAATKGARGTFRCQAKSTGATAVALLFQVSADGREGFEGRLGPEGLALRTLAGQTLWEGKAVRCSRDALVTLEGVVSTDRVRIRVLDPAGALLAESPDRYVSDTNNERSGGIGVRAEDGPAEFRNWSWTAP